MDRIYPIVPWQNAAPLQNSLAEPCVDGGKCWGSRQGEGGVGYGERGQVLWGGGLICRQHPGCKVYDCTHRRVGALGNFIAGPGSSAGKHASCGYVLCQETSSRPVSSGMYAVPAFFQMAGLIFSTYYWNMVNAAPGCLEVQRLKLEQQNLQDVFSIAKRRLLSRCASTLPQIAFPGGGALVNSACPP